ncbi:sugar nucleotide-binding protein [Virgibacillus sp. W0430]|uniref:sugar nucleotide-binding protein n=1 Tax=Virgibacillus sp. W0430 TaxID=3391580 RepID=UPI003F46277C
MKVCIFGASGYIGESVFERLKDASSIETVGTFLEREGEMKSEHLTLLDINEPESFSDFYKKENPDVVIWSVMSGPEEHQLTDQGLMHVITHLTPETKLIYISTDLVFAEGKGPYKPEDPTSTFPDDHFLGKYANAKVKAERIIRNELTNYAIIRTGPVYGRNKAGNWDHLLNAFITDGNEGKTVSYRDDLIRTFTPIETLTDTIIDLVENKKTGLFHVGEKEGKSFYDFMRAMAIMLGYEPGQIIKASEQEEPDHKLPKNISLKIPIEQGK